MNDPAAQAERPCPGCGAKLPVDPALLGDADQLATCTRCGTYFALDDGGIVDAECADPFARATALRLTPATAAPGPRLELPFEVPDDLPPLEPDDDADDRGPRSSRAAVTLFAALLGVVLMAALLGQGAWHYRGELAQRVPRLAALCAAWQCPPVVTAAPERFRVIARDLRVTGPATGVLTLELQLRNDAQFAQPYPVLQLALLDNRGDVVQRGQLRPADYLADPPAPGATVAAGGTVAVTVDIADPGPRATGFAIDFF